MDKNNIANQEDYKNYLASNNKQIKDEFDKGIAVCKYNSGLQKYGSLFIEKRCKASVKEKDWKPAVWIKHDIVYMGDKTTTWRFNTKDLKDWLDKQNCHEINKGTGYGARLFISDADKIGIRVKG